MEGGGNSLVSLAHNVDLIGMGRMVGYRDEE